MTGIEIFIGGGLLLCCATMTAWLIFDARQRTAKPSSPKHDKPELPNKADDGQCCVGKSTFDIDYLERMMAKVAEDTIKTMLPAAVSDLIGDVEAGQVEFAPMSQEESDSGKKFAPMSKDEVSDAFNTDIRDVDDMGPSAPLASGASLDEIEDAVNTAMNDNATAGQQAEAGRILSEIKDSQLFERLAAENDEIDRRVNLCIKMSVRAEIEAIGFTPKPKVVRKSVSFDVPLDNADSFNLADMLP